jgi:hypothetical protein
MHKLSFAFFVIVLSGCVVSKECSMPTEKDVSPSPEMVEWMKIAMPTERKENSENNPVSTASTFNLTKAEIDLFTTKANGGDSEAAFRLAQHYTFAGHSIEKTERKNKKMQWLEVAAKNRHPIAAYNLAFELFYVDRDFISAKKWALIAVSNGTEEAKSLLQLIQDEEEKLLKQKK